MTNTHKALANVIRGGVISASILGAILQSTAYADTFTTLYQFAGGSSGSGALSGLAQDAAGKFYGETNTAGAATCASHYGVPSLGCGTLYSFSRTTGLTTLVTFAGPNGAYGSYTPTLIGSTLYASTLAGGTTDNGVVFSVRTNGSGFKLLHQFTGTDGSQPSAPLVLGPGSLLYGVTAQGGPTYPKKSYGILFRLAADGTYTILHSFTNGADGAAPDSIVLEKNGVIVGSTFSGGNKSSSCGASGCGIIYEYNPRTSKFTVLHSFVNTFHDPGAYPMLGSLSSDGTVYGNSSSFFSESPKVGFTSLPGTSTIDDIGGGINVGPVLGSDGSLISTEEQGNGFAGSLYQQLNGVITVLHFFSGYDGADPRSAPLITPSGSFVGTTTGGGTLCYCGTIYEYVP